MNIWAMMQPTCAIVASMSPRPSVHHGCEPAFPPDAREISFGPRVERPAAPQILNDSSDSGAKSSAGFKRRFASPCSCE